MTRRLRLWSGLVMLAYVTMHLANHAMGLISLRAMNSVLGWVLWLWGKPPAQVLLYGAFLVHFMLALWALWERRSLRLKIGEWFQVVLGFAIPILLARHVVGNRLSHDLFGTTNNYTAVLWVLFANAPWHGALQLVTLVIAWSHAMLGLHFWLKIKPWYTCLQPVALAAAVLFPVLSLLGAIEAGRAIAALAADPAWTREAFAHMRLPSPAERQTLEEIIQILSWSFGGIVAVVLLARLCAGCGSVGMASSASPIPMAGLSR